MPRLASSQVLDEVIPVVGAEIAGDLLTAHERRVADEGIESATVEEDLGELQRPVERLAAPTSSRWARPSASRRPGPRLGCGRPPPATPSSTAPFARSAWPVASSRPAGDRRRSSSRCVWNSDVGEEPLLLLDVARPCRRRSSPVGPASSRVASMIFGIMSRKFGSVIPIPLPSSEKVFNCVSLLMPTSESPRRMAWSRK